MNEVKWKLKNVKTKDIIHISKPIFKVGRHAQADLKTELREVSRNHATLSIVIGGLLYIQDNKSCNGTYINRNKIEPLENRLLQHGDVIGIGVNPQVSIEETTHPLIFEVNEERVAQVVTQSTATGPPEVVHVFDSEEDVQVVEANVDGREEQKKPEEENVDRSLIVDAEDGALTGSARSMHEENDQKVTPPAKQHIEKNNCHYSKNIDDSIIDDCIVISDEEDDEPFAHSQINVISERIKREQTSYHDSIDPYFEIKQEDQTYFDIKQELKDLQCDVENNYIPVDLTDDFDHFESTTDLLNVLESASSIVEPTDKKLDDTSSVDALVDLLESDLPQEATQASTNTHTPLPDVGLVSSTPQKDKDETDNKSRPSEVHEAGREPLKKSTEKTRMVELIPSMMADPRIRTPKKNTRAKRKSTRTEVVSSKKLKQSEDTNTQMTAMRKKEIAAERKKKLREIAIKTTHNIDDAVPSTSSAPPRDPRREKAKNTHTSETDRGDIQDGTVSSNCSPRNDVRHTHNTRSSSRNPPINTIQMADSTVNEDRSGLIWQFARVGREAHSASRPAPSISLNKEIQWILRWSVKWLVEQNTLDISPPVYGDARPIRVPEQFRTHAEYEACMTPLIMLELWQLIYQTAYSKEDERKPVTAFIIHQRIDQPFCCLDCKITMSEQDIQLNAFRQEEFCLIELRVKDAHNKGYQYTSYGLLKDVKKTCSETGYTVRFTLMTKAFDMQITTSKILVKVIGNVGSSFRLFRTVKCLERSPLCNHILKPNTIKSGIGSGDIFVPDKCKLNPLQMEIIAEASEVCMKNTSGLYMIKGPPGTGKSTVIANIIVNVLSRSMADKRPALILLTAPSNAAVDGLILKLMDVRYKLEESLRKNLKLIRLGPDSSINHNVNKFKLTVLAHNNMCLNRSLVSQADWEREVIGKHVDMRVFLQRHLGQRYAYELNVSEDQLFYGANIICTTLNSCVGYRIAQAVHRGRLQFTCCIIDEATQCNEVECLIPVQLGINKFVLVGDPQQLPAVVCNKDAQKLGYGRSLFSRIDDNFKDKSHSPIKMLRDQYRMKAEICEYPNKRYYDGKLRSFPVCNNPIQPPLKPYMIFNLTTTQVADQSDYVNSDEVHLIRNVLETLRIYVKTSCQYSIGVITPYKAQKELISREINKIRMPTKVTVTVNTVDSFQGLENDVIIISCVRYTANYFLQNDQRLNVALTRAKQALYVIGNYTLFKNCKPLYDLREDAKKRKCLLDIRNDPRNISTLHKYIIMD